MNAQSRRTLFAAGLITAALASGASGQQDQKLGKVTFPTSCDPNVQAEFDRGVAMLHSYWFLIARRTFEGILKQDPTCAMAYWGVAMDYLGNTLATTPTRAEAQAAWEALEKARTAGAKTQRERDWIEALSAYFRDHDKVAVGTRLAAYNAAMERMAQSYPDDYEAQVYYALTLQASAPKSDLSYANQIKSAATADRGDRPINFGNFTAKAAMPARYVLERADWIGAAELPMTASQYPMADSLIRFTRGLGMARTGDLAGAKGEIEAMKALRTTLQRADQSYWADRTEEQMLAVSAWIALKEGAGDQALKFMRAAADGEDGSVKHVAMENRLYPFRELLGELLLEMGQPAAALNEFETALKQTPNRFRAFRGAGRAADGAGDRQKASEYFGKLVDLTKNADTDRQEIREAKAYPREDDTIGSVRK
jgi:tetratricopeptide (TPR) repeat protein